MNDIDQLIQERLEGLSQRLTQQRLEGFTSQFVEYGRAHLNLAYHAAFPLILSPDLVYRIWVNFDRDMHNRPLDVPWIATADLLLSDLCRPAGYELYQMRPEIRKILLSQFAADPRFSLSINGRPVTRQDQMARFLMDYSRHLSANSRDPNTQALADVHYWTGLSHSDPAEAARKLTERLTEELDPEDNRPRNDAEVLRLADLADDLITGHEKYKPLKFYLEGVMQLSRGDKKAARRQLKGLDLGQYRALDLELTIPPEIFEVVQPAYTWQELLDVLSEVSERYGERFAGWLREVGILEDAEDEKNWGRLYDGPPIDDWPLTAAYDSDRIREEILEALEKRVKLRDARPDVSAAAATPSLPGRVLGVDLSMGDGPHFNFRQAAEAGVRFCFIRAGSGTGSKDGSFERRYNEAGRAGMLRGLYYFLESEGEAALGSPEAQARHFVKLLKADAELGAVVDVERISLQDGRIRGNPSPEEVERFAAEFEKHTPFARPLMIYTSAGFWSEAYGFSGPAVAWAAKHPLWLAQWIVRAGEEELQGAFELTVPEPWTEQAFHQWTAFGGPLVGHAQKNLDLNYFNGSPEELAQWAEETQAPASPSEPAEPEVLATRYVTGKGGLNMRAGPGSDQPMIQTLAYGTAVEVIGEGEWTHIRVGDDTGYVAAQFLSDEPPPIRYDDFELQIAPGPSGGYRVVASAGDETAELQPVFLSNVEEQLGRLRAAIDEASSSDAGRQVTSSVATIARELGDAMSEAVLSGPVQELFQKSQRPDMRPGRELRIKLRLDAPEIVAWPWEFLRTPGSTDYQGLAANSPFSRIVPFTGANDPSPVALPLRILGIVSNPKSTTMAEFDVDRERERFEQTMARLPGVFGLQLMLGPSLNDLQRTLHSQEWHILYFVGHGMFDFDSNEGLIVLTGESGDATPVWAGELASMLADQPDQPSPRLVVLQSGADVPPGQLDIFAATAEKLARAGIPAVLTIQQKMGDDAAGRFHRRFLAELASGQRVDAAVTAARRAIVRSDPNSLDWGVPMLFTSADDGRIFDIEAPAEDAGQAVDQAMADELAAEELAADVADQPLEEAVTDDTLDIEPEEPLTRQQVLRRFGRPEDEFDILAALAEQIGSEEVIPIIGSAFTGDLLPPAETLARAWAQEIDYPFSLDAADLLPRVAQYQKTLASSAYIANRRYLDFVKKQVISTTTEGRALPQDSSNRTLTDLVLGPEFAGRLNDRSPLRLLARLRQPIYITTSYYSFLERALEDEGAKPRTELCYWLNQLGDVPPSIFELDPGYEPNRDEPLVFHLYGLESVPESLVLSEDDFVDLVVAVGADPDLIPPQIKSELFSSATISMGFDPFTFESRVLRHVLVDERGRRWRQMKVFVYDEAAATQKPAEELEGWREYLNRDFSADDTTLLWASSREFMMELWRALEGTEE